MSDLKPVKTIEPQDWMQAPATRAVMEALGGSAYARFVGGCVRNTLLGLEAGDIDIATRWTPTQATERLQTAGIKVVPTGIDHGTITAIVDRKPFEITTLRRDVETDGRRAVVSFTHDWTEDAQRRDFTMNTLLADEDGHVYDPTGQGLTDLERRHVVFVGDAATRIAEDYLRILRFFRFHALYGQGAPEPAALKACKDAADKIPTLSAERITQEFFRILSVDAPEETLNLMFGQDVLKDFKFPEYDTELLKHFCEFQRRYGLLFLASRLLVFAGLESKNIESLKKTLLIPKVFQKDIEAISQVLNLTDLNNEAAVQTAVYKFGRVPVAQALMIELAQDRVMNGYAPEALKIIQKWDIPQLPINGNDLMKAGIKPGPELGRKLEEIEDWWILEGFRPDKQACLSRITT